MSKKVLLSIAAVALLAMTAFAGDYKYEDWPTATYQYTKTVQDTEEVPALIEIIPVKIHIPYYVIVWPQTSEIILEQVGQSGDERFHFAGTAKWTDSKGKKHKPKIKANFAASLTVSLRFKDDTGAAYPDINSYDSKGKKLSVWTATVDPTSIVALTEYELTITCDVTKVNLMAATQCSWLHVADVLLYIMHQ